MNEAGRLITVNSRKFDGSLRRSWQAGLASNSDDMTVLIGRFNEDVKHKDLGLVRKGTVSFEYFWPDRWYNVFRFHEPDGTLRNHYFNVAMPADLGGDTLDFIDLDLDVVAWPDGRVDVLDCDDFAENSKKYGYPDDVIAKAERALAVILKLIEDGNLP